MYQYQAKLLNVVDGDTVDMEVDLGFGVALKQRLRIKGINTAELHSPIEEERTLAFKAKNFVESTIHLGSSYMIDTYKDDKYGRLLADIHVTKEMTLGVMLISVGLAKPFMV